MKFLNFINTKLKYSFIYFLCLFLIITNKNKKKKIGIVSVRHEINIGNNLLTLKNI